MSGIIWYDETFSITCVVSSRESFLSTAAFSETRVLPLWWSAADQRPPSPSFHLIPELGRRVTGEDRTKGGDADAQTIRKVPIASSVDVRNGGDAGLSSPASSKNLPEYCRSGGSEAGPEGRAPLTNRGCHRKKGATCYKEKSQKAQALQPWDECVPLRAALIV